MNTNPMEQKKLVKGSSRLRRVIESSKNRISMPNDCYNSGVVDGTYQRNSGAKEPENVQVSICYGKPTQFVIWKDGKELISETISTSKIEFDGRLFKNRYFTLSIKL